MLRKKRATIKPKCRVLATKVGVVLVDGLVGLSNSILLYPKLIAPIAKLLKEPEGWTPFKISQFAGLLLAEAGLGLLVILLAGIGMIDQDKLRMRRKPSNQETPG